MKANPVLGIRRRGGAMEMHVKTDFLPGERLVLAALLAL
jgi:hypothetical protein